MLLTRHKVWISTATIACFPTRPLHVCLQTEHSLLADHLPTVSSYQLLRELLLSTLYHATSADRPHSLSRATSCVAPSDD